jgi:hypothetical protein
VDPADYPAYFALATSLRLHTCRAVWAALVGWAVDLAGGAEIVQSVYSPDMEFEAYVVDYPSIDRPTSCSSSADDNISSSSLSLRGRRCD